MISRKILWLLVGVVTILALVTVACAAEPAPEGEEVAPSEEEDGDGAIPSAAEGKTFRWKSQQIHSAGSLTFEHGVALCDRIEAMSGGRLVIENFPAGALVPALQELDAVQAGTIDVMLSPGSIYKGQLGNVSNFWTGYPAGPGPVEMMKWVYEGGGEELYREMLERAGYDKAEFIGFFVLTSAESFCWSNEPIDSLDDFDGLKFRCGGMWGNVLAGLGASVVTLPGGELYQSLERGVIDAFEYCNPGMDWTMGFYEIAKYWGGPGIHSPMSWCEMLINEDRWNELPDDLQEIVRGAVDSMLARTWAEHDMTDVMAMSQLENEGVEIILLSQEVQDAVVEASDAYLVEQAAQDEFFKKVWESQKAFLAAYRPYKDQVQPKIGS